MLSATSCNISLHNCKQKCRNILNNKEVSSDNGLRNSAASQCYALKLLSMTSRIPLTPVGIKDISNLPFRCSTVVHYKTNRNITTQISGVHNKSIFRIVNIRENNISQTNNSSSIHQEILSWRTNGDLANCDTLRNSIEPEISRAIDDTNVEQGTKKIHSNGILQQNKVVEVSEDETCKISVKSVNTNRILKTNIIDVNLPIKRESHVFSVKRKLYSKSDRKKDIFSENSKKNICSIGDLISHASKYKQQNLKYITKDTLVCHRRKQCSTECCCRHLPRGSIAESVDIYDNGREKHKNIDAYQLDKVFEQYTHGVSDTKLANEIGNSFRKRQDILEFRWNVIDNLMKLSYEVVKVFNMRMRRSTIHLAASLFDRYLISIMSKNMQVDIVYTRSFDFILECIPCEVAFCVLHISLKMEEVNGHGYIRNIKNRFDMSKIVYLEEHILQEIDYQVNAPLSIDIVHFVFKKLDMQADYRSSDVQLVAFLLDIFYYSPMSIYTPPSKAACAAIKLVKHIRLPTKTSFDLWPQEFRLATGYSMVDLKPIVIEMNRMLRNSDLYVGALLMHSSGWSRMSWI